MQGVFSHAPECRVGVAEPTAGIGDAASQVADSEEGGAQGETRGRPRARRAALGDRSPPVGDSRQYVEDAVHAAYAARPASPARKRRRGELAMVSLARRGRRGERVAEGRSMSERIRVMVWNEFVHERGEAAVGRIYPKGIHSVIAESLAQDGRFSVGTATLEEAENGLPKSALEGIDVLVWWGHWPTTG